MGIGNTILGIIGLKEQNKVKYIDCVLRITKGQGAAKGLNWKVDNCPEILNRESSGRVWSLLISWKDSHVTLQLYSPPLMMTVFDVYFESVCLVCPFFL